MSEVNHPARGDRVPLSQKVAYGFGMLGNQLFAAVMTVFMVILVMALNMDPLLAGILTAAPRIFDAVTDPIMGYVTDNAHPLGPPPTLYSIGSCYRWFCLYGHVAALSRRFGNV